MILTTAPGFSPVAGLVASIAIFFIGFFWFNGKTFFPIWWRLIGKEGDPGQGKHGMGVLFGSVAVANLVQGMALAWLLPKFASAGVLSLAQGLGYGALFGLAFAAAPSLGHRLFGQQGFRVWLIEVGADVLGLAVAGAIISLFY
jgi:hypothetical protein